MRTPVAIIPGFFGSTLIQQNTTLANRLVWLSKLELAIYGPDNMDLATNGLQPGPLAGNPLLPGNASINDMYAPLINQLQNDGWEPQTFPYDWRFAVAYNAQRLGQQLAAAFPAIEFWVVAHSMGGLLARLAYETYAALCPAANWQRTVYLGVPHGGTYTASAGLAGANPKWSWWQQFYSVLGAPVRRLTDPLGSFADLQDRINQVVASWPGVGNCLPSNYGQWSNLDPTGVAELFKVANYSNNSHVTAPYLVSANAMVEELNAQLATPRPAEVCVCGTGKPTPATLDDKKLLAADAGYLWSYLGDGVVLVARGQLSDRKTLTLPTDHYGIVQGGQILSRINALLRDGLPDNKLLDSAPVQPPPNRFEGIVPPIRSTIEWHDLQRVNDP